MKSETRKSLIKHRDGMSRNEVENYSRKIFDFIINWDCFRTSNYIMLYHSFRNEVDTIDLIKYCLENSKTVILPKSIKEGFKLIPCRVNSLSELKKSNFGIYEPSGENVVDRELIDMVIVPGVAYDREGYRLGYGAGFYDRFLENYNGTKAGICYDFQLIDNVYKDEHDVRMDYLITERGIIKTGDA